MERIKHHIPYFVAMSILGFFVCIGFVNAWTNPTQAPPGGGPGGSTDPVGTMNIYGGTSAPTGWLLCDGSAVSRVTYDDLFAVIGVAYGAGDGSTTFNVPNMKGKVVVGYNASETEFDAMGETGGEKTHALTSNELPSHYHSVDPPNAATTWSGDHVHWYALGDPNEADGHNNDGDAFGNAWGTNTAAAGNHQHTVDIGAFNSGSVGSNQPLNVLQPYVIAQYIIKY